MPEVYDEEIKAEPAVSDPGEQELVKKLFEYTDEKQNPWRRKYHTIIKECYDFVELNQWSSDEMALLKLDDTPALPVDRIGRNLDVIEGIAVNTGNTKKVVKKEQGDERVASILDSLLDSVSYLGGFSKVRKEARASMMKTGIFIYMISAKEFMSLTIMAP